MAVAVTIGESSSNKVFSDHGEDDRDGFDLVGPTQKIYWARNADYVLCFMEQTGI